MVDGILETGLLSFRISDISCWTAVIGMNEGMKVYIWRLQTSTQSLACSVPDTHSILHVSSHRLKLPKTFMPIKYKQPVGASKWDPDQRSVLGPVDRTGIKNRRRKKEKKQFFTVSFPVC